MDSLPPPLPNFSDTNYFASSNNLNVLPASNSAPDGDNLLIHTSDLHQLGSNNNHSLSSAGTGSNLHPNQGSEFNTQLFQDIRIDSSILEKDPIICCPICKEQFCSGMEVKMLPCKHMYDKVCILKWLKIKNTCPVCRFQLLAIDDMEYDVLGLIPEEFLAGGGSENDFQDSWVPPIRRIPRSNDLPRLYHYARQTGDFLHRLRYHLHCIVEQRNSLMMRLNRDRRAIEESLTVGLGHQLEMERETGSEDLLLSPTQSGEANHSVAVDSVSS